MPVRNIIIEFNQFCSLWSCLFTSNLIHRSFFRLNRLNTGVSPMKKTTKISGAPVNLTTASVHRLIKPMNKTTHGLHHKKHNNDLGRSMKMRAAPPVINRLTAKRREASSVKHSQSVEIGTVVVPILEFSQLTTVN
jgi:hypothetical protein